MKRTIKKAATALTILSLLTITGCASVPRDRGLSEVGGLVQDKNGGTTVPIPGTEAEQFLTDSELKELLSKPISMSEAERISLQRNPMLKVKLGNVGLAEADYAQAGRLRNPGFSYERISSEESAATLLFDINSLLLMPLRRRIESGRLQMARYTAAGDVLSHLTDTRAMWIQAVADKHQVALIERALEAAETSNTLTRQMSAIGHSSVLEAAESEVFVGEIKAVLSRQKLAANSSREALIRQLGLWGPDAVDLTIPDALPEPPANLTPYTDIAQQAVDARLDVQQARFNLDVMARNLSLTRKTGFVNVFEVGPVREKTEEGRETGYEIELVLPIFDMGGIKTERARIALNQAQEEAKATAINAASEAREALWNYYSAWEIVRYYKDELLPLRTRISQENLLRYNGMLISVFDLLNDARDAAGTAAGYVDALKTFWLADMRLKGALVGAGDASMGMASESVAMPGGGGEEGH